MTPPSHDLQATVEPIRVHRDARGLVFEPLEPAAFPSQHNAHVVLTEPGAIRGNHYHERGTEVMVVLGPALVRLREGGIDRDVDVPEGQVFRFVFPPGLPHAIKNTGSAPQLVVSFNTEVHDPERPDVVRVPLIEG